MQQLEVISILKKDLNFNDRSIEKLKKFVELILNENKNHNLIAKSTESSIWDRHILDSAQLVKFIDFKLNSLADLGSGAGFPGLIIEIFNKNKDFHVKLYEKSPVKRQFLSKVIKELNLSAEECWMIGDNLITDILGGNNFGLTTLHKYQYKKDIRYNDIFPDANFNEFSSLNNLINEII